MKKTLLAALSLFAALNLASCSANIKPGEVAIQIPNAGLSRELQNSDIKVGRIWYNPLTTTVLKYPTTVSTIEYKGDDAVTFQDKDGLSMKVDSAFSLRVDRDKVPYIYNKYKKDADSMLQGIVRTMFKDTITRVSGQYVATDIYGPKRAQFQDEVQHQLAERLKVEGFIVEQLSFTGEMTVPAQVRDALNRSQAATQQAIQAENELRKTKAEGQKKIAEAQANAQATLMDAEATAKANRTIAASLTPELVQLKQIQRWDGKLSVVSGAAGTLVNLPGDLGAPAQPASTPAQ